MRREQLQKNALSIDITRAATARVCRVPIYKPDYRFLYIYLFYFLYFCRKPYNENRYCAIMYRTKRTKKNEQNL